MIKWEQRIKEAKERGYFTNIDKDFVHIWSVSAMTDFLNSKELEKLAKSPEWDPYSQALLSYNFEFIKAVKDDKVNEIDLYYAVLKRFAEKFIKRSGQPEEKY